MRRRAFALSAALALVAGCTVFEDNGTHLAHDLERGAKQLRESRDTGLVVRYVPLGGADQAYSIEMAPSRRVVKVDALGNIDAPGGGYLVVSGKHAGGTSYHERFVFTPERLRIEKDRGATEVVLRKAGERIDVVELR